MTQPDPQETYRQRLIRALAVVIARDGFNGAKIQDVVKEAHVSLRTFYAEFPNKEACFLELNDQLVVAMIDLVEASIDFDKPWREVISDAFTTYLNALSLQPRLTHAGLIELATLSDAARVRRQNGLDQFVTMMVDLVDRGREVHPEVPSRPLSPMMARAILGGVIELMTDRVVRGTISSLPDLVETATEMVWSVVTNVPSTPELDADPAGNPPNTGVASPAPSSGTGVRR